MNYIINMLGEANIPNLKNMGLSSIAMIVKKDWKKVHYSAAPYLSAMSSMASIKDRYFADSGYSIVSYFLSNASSWKGPVAKEIKKELNRRLKENE